MFIKVNLPPTLISKLSTIFKISNSHSTWCGSVEDCIFLLIIFLNECYKTLSIEQIQLYIYLDLSRVVSSSSIIKQALDRDGYAQKLGSLSNFKKA